MGSYFLPRVGVPNNDDRVIGFRNNRTNRFAVRRTNIFIHRKNPRFSFCSHVHTHLKLIGHVL